MNIVKQRKKYFILSGILLVPGLLSLIIFGLNLSIDYRGGTISVYDVNRVELKGDARDDIEEGLKSRGIAIESLDYDGNDVIARTEEFDVTVSEGLTAELKEKHEKIHLEKFETVGASISRENIKNAFIALGASLLAVGIYLSFAFRNVPKPYAGWRFGLSAVLAMLHDILLLVGVFSILGKVFGVLVDSLFIPAALVVVGYSIHDTIIIFDRIRENLRKLPTSWSFEKVVNFSAAETINRSVSTSLLVLLVLFSLLTLGGDSLVNFVLALFIGILAGTYSSIFVATPLLVVLQNFKLKIKPSKRR